jgi:light-regulated signal transduction histidine kinase (bacteriophytochrome)
MRTDSIAVATEQSTSNLTDIKYILSNHLNTEVANLKTLVQLLETEEDGAKRQEAMIFMASITTSLENAVISLNKAAYDSSEL